MYCMKWPLLTLLYLLVLCNSLIAQANPQTNRITRVTTPDGSIMKINHPEGASDEDILRFAAQNYKPELKITDSAQNNEMNLSHSNYVLVIFTIFISCIIIIAITFRNSLKHKEEKSINPRILWSLYAVCIVLSFFIAYLQLNRELTVALLDILNGIHYITVIIALIWTPIRLVQSVLKKDKRYLYAGLFCGLIPITNILFVINNVLFYQ